MRLDPPGTNPDHDELPRVLPVRWELTEVSMDGAMFRNRSKGVIVIATVMLEQDGKRWLHISASRRSRIPSWEDLKVVKNLFIGPKRKAIQILPCEAEYVNINPNVLHLWCCLDGDPLPDFTHGTGSL